MSSEIGRENSTRQLGQRRNWLLPDIDAHCLMHLRCSVQPHGGRRYLLTISKQYQQLVDILGVECVLDV